MGLPVTELQLWEQKVFEFGIELPIPEMEIPPIDWGGAGLNWKVTCPGATYCGNPSAEENCTLEIIKPFKVPSFSVEIPFPPEISIPPLKVRFAFPPKAVMPIYCPNYPESEGPPSE